MRRTAEPLAVGLTRLGRALVASGTTFWTRSLEIGLRHARLLPDPAAGTGKRVPLPDGGGRALVDAYRHYASEMALVPWLALDQLGAELAGGGEPRAPHPAVVAGKTVPIPTRVRRAMQGLAVYAVPAPAALRLLQARRIPFAPVPLGFARAAVAVTGARYASSDLGAHDEIGVALLVTPRSRPWAPGLHFLELPVNGHLSCEAGKAIWGYPKTEETLEMTSDRSRVAWTLRAERGGARVLTLGFPRGGGGSSTSIPLRTYTLFEGKAHRTVFTRTGRGERILAGTGPVTLSLGAPGTRRRHRVVETLRQLGLPGAPLILHAWTEAMSGEFGPPLLLR
jgi:hypothetical protein